MMSKTYDAIVVGSGSVGTPVAYNLAKSGLSVLVLDKRASAGQGENKAAIGGIRATHSDPAKIILCKRSLDQMSVWKEDKGFDVDFKRGGYVFPVYTPELKKTLKGLLTTQKKYDLNIDWVSSKKMQELVPGINLDGLLGGTYSPDDGQLSPLKVPVAFQREAMKHGADFHFLEEVKKYEIESGKVKAVLTDKNRYETRHLVIATGADAADDGEKSGIKIPVSPDSHEAGITAPVEHFLKPLVVDMRPGKFGKTANFYFGQNTEGQLIFCYTPSQLFPGKCKDNLSEFLPILAARMISLMPRMKNLLVRRIWRGLYPMTPDGVPIVDKVEQIKGLVLAVGMCGQGFMLGPGVATEVTSLVIDDKTSLPPEAHQAISYKRDFYKASLEALK